MYFSCCFRKIHVNDLLPTSKTTDALRTLHFCGKSCVVLILGIYYCHSSNTTNVTDVPFLLNSLPMQQLTENLTIFMVTV